MKIHVPIAINHPGRLDPDSFLASFVARGDFAEFLLDKLRQMPAIGEHHIVIGPRGMGKTSMLRRLAIGIARESDLRARYIPLGFREEQYNVRSLDALWRNCAEALAEWCEQNDKPEIASEIDRSLLDDLWRQSQSALDAFLDLVRRLGGRPVLFIDNLDLILDALTKEQNWELRRVLQAPGGPIVFGAAAHMLEQGADRDAAFYEFFHPHILDPLTESEVFHCMGRLADARGDAGKPVREVLASDPQRIRTLHTLTGGNPRVLALLYQLLERTESETVFADLEALLDQLTPYYKARVEDYQTDLQRAVIDAIALSWDPISSHDLSSATAVDITTISSQLARLKRDGLVEDVQTSGARSGYQLVERFFNIWYLMRHGTRRTRQKVQWLTAFLKSFYAPAELSKMRLDATEARAQLHPLYREALEAAGEALLHRQQANSLEKVIGIASELQSVESKDVPELAVGKADSESFTLMSDTLGLPSLGQDEETITGYDNSAGRFGTMEESARERVARSLLSRGFKLGSLRRREEAIAVYDDVLVRFGTAEELALREQVARALISKGITLGSLGRSEEAVAVYGDVLMRFGTAEEPALREQVARALVNRGFRLGSLGRSEEAIAVYDDVLERFETAKELALREGVARALTSKGVTLVSLGRSEEAIAVYDDVLVRFGTAEELALREQVARALIGKGIALGSLGRSEEAIAVYGDVLMRFGTAEEPALREQVARALVNRGFRLGSLGRSEEAIAVYDDVLERFETAKEPALRERVARALVNKGFRLGSLGRSEEAIAVYDNVLERFGTSEEPALRERVARALVNKGAMLGSIGQHEKEIAAYDDVLERFGTAKESALRDQVARALINKSITFGSLRRSKEAITVCDEVVERFGASEEPALREYVARALVSKGFALGSLERSEEAIAVYDDVVERFGASEELALRAYVARALFNRGFRLGSLGRSEEAIAVYDDVLERFGALEEPALREQVARALVNKGVTLGSLRRNEKEIAVYDDVLERFGTAKESALREQVARALINKGITFGSLGRSEEAITVYEDAVQRFGASEEPALRDRVARALVNKGLTLGSLGRSEEAITVYEDVVQRFGASEEPALREQVARALVNRGFRLGSLGRSEEAIAVYDEVLERFGTSEEPALREIVIAAAKLTASLWNEQGRFREAIVAGRRAIELDPQDDETWINLGNVLADHSGSVDEAEAAYRSAMVISNGGRIAEANLAWLMLASGRTSIAASLREALGDLHPVGKQLLDAAFEFVADNFGAATERLQEALTGDQEQLNTIFSDDLLRLLRLAEARHYGEKLIAWFVESGQADRIAPIYAAFIAYVRGDRYLLDFSPEVRKPAERVLRWLNSHRVQQSTDQPSPAPKRRRGRPPGKLKKA